MTVFGHKFGSPVFIAPTGSNRAFHTDGEMAVARAAKTADALQMLSTVATTSIENASEARGQPVWFQLYPPKDWEACKKMVQRAEAAGTVYDLTRLASFPWPFKGEAKILTANLDRSVAHIAAPEGSDRIYFTYEHAGLERLHSVSYAGNDVRDEPSPTTGSIATLAAGASTLPAHVP